MDLTVVDANGLPNRAFLSVRAGEIKRMRPFRPGETFNFCNFQDPDGFVQLDVYEKIGSQMIHGLNDADGGTTQDKANEVQKQVNIPLDNGHAVSTDIRISWSQELQSRKRDTVENTKHKMALAAKNYLDLYDVWGAVHGMLTELLKLQPVDPIDFMIEHLTKFKQKHGKTSTLRSSPSTPFGKTKRFEVDSTFPIGGGEV